MALPDTHLSPIAELSAARFQGKTLSQENVYTVSNLAMTRIPNNQNRVFWIATNEGANDVRVSTVPNISATSGFLLALGGGVLSMDWAQDGEGVSYDIYLIAVGAPSNVRLREVIRQ